MKRHLLPLLAGTVSLAMSSCTTYVSDNGPPPSNGRAADPNYIGAFPDQPGYAGPHPGGSKNFGGGPRDWYNTGFVAGKADRLAHMSEDYRRHSEKFDEQTMREFAHGYDDGYLGHNEH